MANSARSSWHAGGATRALVALAVGLSGFALAGCGGEVADSGLLGAGRSIGIDGVSIELPSGWDGYATPGSDDAVPAIWAASTAFSEPSGRPEFPRRTLAALPDDGVVVEIVAQPSGIDLTAFPQRASPIALADGYFLADAYEGQTAPHVSTQIIQARLADRALYVQVYFGRNRPDDEMRARADRILATLTVAGGVKEAREGSFARFHDPEAGITGRYPEARTAPPGCSRRRTAEAPPGCSTTSVRQRGRRACRCSIVRAASVCFGATTGFDLSLDASISPTSFSSTAASTPSSTAASR